jgi:hypothetical protein
MHTMNSLCVLADLPIKSRTLAGALYVLVLRPESSMRVLANTFIGKKLHELFYFDMLLSISVISNRILNSDFHMKKSYVLYVWMM